MNKFLKENLDIDTKVNVQKMVGKMWLIELDDEDENMKARRRRSLG